MVCLFYIQSKHATWFIIEIKMMQNKIYNEINPYPKLRRLVLNYWTFEYAFQESHCKENETLQHIVPPDACASLVFYYQKSHNIKHTFFVGPAARAYKPEVLPESIFLGIRFFPGSLNTMFSVRHEELCEGKIPADKYINNAFAKNVFKQLSLGAPDFNYINKYLLNYIENTQPIKNDNVLPEIIEFIIQQKGKTNVSNIINKFPMSERKLLREFKNKIGLTPIEFIRIRKIRATITDYLFNEKNNQLDVALKGGYYDQSHWIRELQKLTGEKPTVIKAYLSQIYHENVIV